MLKSCVFSVTCERYEEGDTKHLDEPQWRRAEEADEMTAVCGVGVVAIWYDATSGYESIDAEMEDTSTWCSRELVVADEEASRECGLWWAIQIMLRCAA